MTPLASMADLVLSVPDAEESGLFSDLEHAERQLDLASDMIRAYTGQTLTAATSTATLYPVRRVAMLPERPVRAITEVSIDGTVWATNDYWWTDEGHLWRIGGYWAAPLVVEYDHGYETVPGDLVRLCASLARVLVEDKVGVRSESLGSASVTYLRSASGEEVAITADQKMVLDRYKAIIGP